MAFDTRRLSVDVASGDALDVREFSIEERMSALFSVVLVVLTENVAVDFDEIVGQPARFTIKNGLAERTFAGIVSRMEQTGVEEGGLSTYALTIVPRVWLLTQRRNHRIFQHVTEPDIALALLSEWSIPTDVRIDKAAHKKRKYRVQYGESDHAFAGRMLEDAGISYFFADDDGETRLVLSDAPGSAPPARPPLAFIERWSPGIQTGPQATAVRLGQRVRPGRYTMRDRDYRLPASYPLMASAESGGGNIESRLERFHYTPGAFLFAADRGDSTPVADDKQRTRSDEPEAAILAKKRLDAKRASAKHCTFQTNALDLAPGMTVAMSGHPHPMLAGGSPLLVVASRLSGTSTGEWTHTCEARSTDVPYRPAVTTPKPRVGGVETATVVGPPGEEIHTDEFGRVRVHFHWDRNNPADDKASCWIPVSQGWAGMGYGMIHIPRVGQEVLVDFLGGDPDRPMVVGRVYTNQQRVPYALPGNKTRSAWKSNSTGGTGGYNEIMFEDAGGRELIHIQAEKDLTKLVKHDETVTIDNDRTKTVHHDDTLTVDNDRTKTVHHDERVTIDNDRTEKVGQDERITIGRHRTEKVGQDETITIGRDRIKMVYGNEEVVIEGSRTSRIFENEDTTIEGSRTRQVDLDERETTGQSRNMIVGASLSTQVGVADTTVAGSSHSVTVAPPESAPGPGTTVSMVHDRIELSTPGGARLVMEGDRVFVQARHLEIDMMTIDMHAHDTVTIYSLNNAQLKSLDGGVDVIAGKKALVWAMSQDAVVQGSSGATLTASGGDVVIVGGPMVKINT